MHFRDQCGKLYKHNEGSLHPEEGHTRAAIAWILKDVLYSELTKRRELKQHLAYLFGVPWVIL